jgi:hypothetical protein
MISTASAVTSWTFPSACTANWGLACWNRSTRRSSRHSSHASAIASNQHPVDIAFEDLRFESAFRIDILVESRLLIEVKSVDQLHPAHAKQLIT